VTGNIGRGKFVRTPEIREKHRKAITGKKLLPLSDELKAKMRIVHLQPEVRDKHRIAFLGEKNPMKRSDVREKIRDILRESPYSMFGEDNPNWCGGISCLPYPIGFSDSLKECIRARDGYQCQKCGVTQLECIHVLCIHHIDYDKENLVDANLITLCRSCNAQVNFNRAFWVIVFRMIMYRRFG